MLIKFNVGSNKMSRSRCCSVIGSLALTMGSNEVLLVIVEKAHCWSQRGNISGMGYSRQPVERFITQSNWDILSLHVPC